jgi:hypothetical protein
MTISNKKLQDSIRDKTLYLDLTEFDEKDIASIFSFLDKHPEVCALHVQTPPTTATRPYGFDSNILNSMISFWRDNYPMGGTMTMSGPRVFNSNGKITVTGPYLFIQKCDPRAPRSAYSYLGGSEEIIYHSKPPNTVPMMVLGGFIAVLGIAAVAIAFVLLHAATLGLAGLLVVGAGMAATLLGVGLFSYGARQYNHHGRADRYSDACDHLAEGHCQPS